MLHACKSSASKSADSDRADGRHQGVTGMTSRFWCRGDVGADRLLLLLWMIATTSQGSIENAPCRTRCEIVHEDLTSYADGAGGRQPNHLRIDEPLGLC